ncbi:hypothetical protein B0T21DRAFT_411898 [Apiosordaria backusii]|uniref:Uncharacterized protein n=1 Tax=Apiosordaria backusii TaxID=314023 RepID=A0AA40BM94_9PEZI|nr:hypothetical protein B0T21DRAFT_411898 [Apiosordaria backusii]
MMGWKIDPVMNAEFAEFFGILSSLESAKFELETTVPFLPAWAMYLPMAVRILVISDCRNAVDSALDRCKVRGDLKQSLISRIRTKDQEMQDLRDFLGTFITIEDLRIPGHVMERNDIADRIAAEVRGPGTSANSAIYEVGGKRVPTGPPIGNVHDEVRALFDAEQAARIAEQSLVLPGAYTNAMAASTSAPSLPPIVQPQTAARIPQPSHSKSTVSTVISPVSVGNSHISASISPVPATITDNSSSSSTALIHPGASDARVQQAPGSTPLDLTAKSCALTSAVTPFEEGTAESNLDTQPCSLSASTLTMLLTTSNSPGTVVTSQHNLNRVSKSKGKPGPRKSNPGTIAKNARLEALKAYASRVQEEQEELRYNMEAEDQLKDEEAWAYERWIEENCTFVQLPCNGLKNDQEDVGITGKRRRSESDDEGRESKKRVV